MLICNFANLWRTLMTGVYELNDAELDAVCGGGLVTINGPLVSFNNSFNFAINRSTQIGLIFGGGQLQQFAGLLGVAGSFLGLAGSTA
jgi:hypothetical protein